MAPVLPALAKPSMAPLANARIGLGLKGLGGMVAHLDDLRGRNDVEALRGAAFGFEYGFDFRFVAEQYDAAVRPDRFKCQYGALNRRLRSEIAAHGIYTNL